MTVSPVYRHLGVWKEKDVTIVRFGEHRILDELTVNKLGDELYSVADHADCKRLLLNFASVDHLTTLMLGKLLMLRRKMESKGGKFALCELEPRVREVFASTNLDKIVAMYDSEVDAVRALSAQP